MKKAASILLLLMSYLMCFSQEEEKKTTFKFGGYIKADFLHTWYMNGDLGANSPMRDFHFPAQIPVGEADQNYELDYHAKETRFNFDVKTVILKQNIRGFLELDFLASKQGDEKTSNSFSPRLRHAFFETDRFLIGQTWSTFMIVLIPDELDFSGAMDGLVFIRQPQVRFKAGSWWFSLENPETTITQYQGSSTEVTDAEILPDMVVRKNFKGNWGTWSIAGIGRILHKSDSVSTTTIPGFGITTGGKLLVGKKGDDIRIMATYGNGTGRYVGSGFSPGAVIDQDNEMQAVSTLNGYIAYNHYWVPEKLSSSFSISVFQAFYDESLVDPGINASSYSLSGNIKWDPVSKIRIGAEYMYGYRELLGGTNGAFHRLQFSGKYYFGYKNSAMNERR